MGDSDPVKHIPILWMLSGYEAHGIFESPDALVKRTGNARFTKLI